MVFADPSHAEAYGAAGIGSRNELRPSTKTVDRTVRKNKRPALTLKDLSFNILEQELCRLLSIINLADPLKIVPGDLE
jgi:hypothetical protein